MRVLFAKYPNSLLVIVMLVGAILRFTGLFHGLTFHPDERSNIMHVQDMSFQDMNPHFFAYGSLPFYLLFFIKILVGLVNAKLATYIYLFKIGRLISASLGVMTVYTTYLLGKRFFNRWIGLISASFLALTVLHIQYSRFYAVDIMMTFVVTLIFLSLLKISRYGRLKDYILTGVLFGTGLAVKVSISPLFLAVLWAHFLNAKKTGTLSKLHSHALLLLLIVLLISTFLVCQPYTLLDYDSFIHGVREQGNMVTGKWQPPYTIQYEKTIRFIYPLEQMMKWSMGYPLFLASIGGLLFGIIRLRKQWFSSEILIFMWIIPYFLITGSFQVKFLRYMLPIFPFLCLLGGRFFYTLIRPQNTPLVRNLGRISITLTYIYLICYSFSFWTIYLKPHPYITASRWIYDTLSSQETILTEHWDDALPVSIPEKHTRPRTKSLPLYMEDKPSKIEAIAASLEEGDYIVHATKRLYGSIGKLPERYPVTSRYYQLLLSEKLGYRLVKTFQLYPSLFGFEIVDDLADESFSVYDHPKVTIYSKIKFYPQKELLKILNTPLDPSEQIPFDTLLRVRTFGDEVYHPFEKDFSLGSLFILYFFIMFITIMSLPLSLQLCRGNERIAYPLARLIGLILPAYIVWVLVALDLFTFNRSTFVLGILILLFFSYICITLRKPIIDILLKGNLYIKQWELLFIGAFLFFLIIRAFNPDIFWGEKPMDFSFLNACYRAQTLPLDDPWFSGKNMNYYYFGYFHAAFIGRILTIAPGIMFNLYISLIPAMALSLCVALIFMLTRRLMLSLWGSIFIILGSNISAFFQWAFEHKTLNWGLWWDTSRIFSSPAINEYPIWSFLFADMHAHVMAFPLTLMVIIVFIQLLTDLNNRKKRNLIISILYLSFFLAVLGMTNSWDLITYSIFVVSGLLILPERYTYKASIIRYLGMFIKHLFVATLVLLLSIIWTLPYYLEFKGKRPGVGMLDSSFALMDQLLIHLGHFLIPIYLICLTLIILNYHKRRNKGFNTGRRQIIRILVREAILIIFFLLVYIFIKQFTRQVMIIGILVALPTVYIMVNPKKSFYVRLTSYLVFFSGLIFIGTETIVISDRMNTIFKFYYPVWLLTGLACVLCINLFSEYNRKMQDKVSVVLRKRINNSIKRYPLITITFSVIILMTLFGTIVGITTVLSLTRVDPIRPTLDGRKYMVLKAPEDYVCTQWMNKHIQGRPVLAEAYGDAYQQYGRISMHTGLTSVMGWEHHVKQRGAPPDEIVNRKRDIELLYTSNQGDVVSDILDRYHIEFVYFGQLEQKKYGDVNPDGFSLFPDILRPVFTYETTTIYQSLRGSVSKAGFVRSPLSIASQNSSEKRYKKSRKLRDWTFSSFISISQTEQQHGLFGITIDSFSNILLSDAIHGTLFRCLESGECQEVDKLGNLEHVFDYPSFLYSDQQNNIWLSDTDNARIIKIKSGENFEYSVAFSTPFIQPSGITGDNEGNLYFTDFVNGNIYRWSSKEDRMTLFSSNLGSPMGIDLLSSKQLIIYDGQHHDIIILTLDSNESKRVSLGSKSGFVDYEGFVAATDQGTFFVVESHQPLIRLFSQEGVLLREFDTGLEKPRCITYHDDCLLIVDGLENAVFKLCPIKAKTMFEGGEGSLPGQFDQPRSMARDRDGNFYICDTKNHRIQKFDQHGKYLLQWGEQGDRRGQFNEPMGIAIGPENSVFIADTWNQRIQVFDDKGDFLKEWYDSFYGPREIIVHNGKVFVSDTGNNIIKVYSLDGKRIRAIGKKGQKESEFKEPIGLAFYEDELVVCDTYNARIQFFDERGQFKRMFTVKSWTKDGPLEPYITLVDNLMMTTDTRSGKLLVYSLTGELLYNFFQLERHFLHSPRKMIWSENDQLLYVLDMGRNKVITVSKDFLTGKIH